MRPQCIAKTRRLPTCTFAAPRAVKTLCVNLGVNFTAETDSEGQTSNAALHHMNITNALMRMIPNRLKSTVAGFRQSRSDARARATVLICHTYWWAVLRKGQLL